MTSSKALRIATTNNNTAEALFYRRLFAVLAAQGR
jgi:hypothetical protein